MEDCAEMRFDFAAETNVGLVRDRNDDSFCLAADPGAPNALAAVADGVGGHADGDLASYLCCRELLRGWRRGGFADMPAGAGLKNSFLELIETANLEVCRQNHFGHRRVPMCTTLVAAVFTPELVYVFNVGDSPCMVFRDGVLTQITEDHHFCESSTIISRAVGVMPGLEVDSREFPLRPHDRFLLCSDGLTCGVGNDAAAGILGSAETPRGAVDALLKAALVAGGHDNVTVATAF